MVGLDSQNEVRPQFQHNSNKNEVRPQFQFQHNKNEVRPQFQQVWLNKTTKIIETAFPKKQ